MPFPETTETKMPRVKKTAEQSAEPAESVASNGVAQEVLSLLEAAAYLRVSEADVLQLIEEQALPARRIGKEWRLLKSAIRNWLSVEGKTSSAKAAQLGAAGSWKDDPLVEEELRETYRRRRTASAGDEL